MQPRLPARVSLALLLLSGIAALWLLHGWLRAPYITNDGYQYLDAAANLVSSGCLCTNVVHFDEQAAAKRMPVPLTHFPPAYPLLIAGLIRLGLTPETSGYLISAIGFLIGIWLLWDIATVLGGSPLTTFAFGALWIVHYGALFYASAILSESAFTAVILALIAIVVRDLRAEGKHPPLLVGLGALAGVAFALRTAGLFLILPTLLYVSWRWWRNRETFPWALASVCAMCLFVVPVEILKLVYAGAWLGGYEAASANPPALIMSLTIEAFYRIFLSEYRNGSRQAEAQVFLALIVAACLLGFLGWRRGIWAGSGKLLPRGLAAIGIFTIPYVIGIFAASMRTNAVDLLRYYLPAYPPLLAGLAALVSSIRITALRLGLTGMALLIVALHVPAFRQPQIPLHIAMDVPFREEAAPGQTVQQWLLDHVPPGAAILAEEGQAMHYVLQRPVVSIIEPSQSHRGIDEFDFLSLMIRFKARYIVLFPGEHTLQNSIPFLHGLGYGQRPDWLTLRVRTPRVVIYECGACVK